jgi:hypothetical protein
VSRGRSRASHRGVIRLGHQNLKKEQRKMVWLTTEKITCAKAALPRHAPSPPPPGAGVRTHPDVCVWHLGICLMSIYLTGVPFTSVYLICTYLTDIHLMDIYLMDEYLTSIHLTSVSHISHGRTSYQRVPYERVLCERCLRSPVTTILTTDKMQLFYSVVRT